MTLRSSTWCNIHCKLNKFSSIETVLSSLTQTNKTKENTVNQLYRVYKLTVLYTDFKCKVLILTVELLLESYTRT